MENKTKVLVIGGSGFIGNHLVNSLLNKKAIVTVYDKEPSKNKKVKFVKGDVTKEFKGLTYDFDYIFHLAGVNTLNENIMFDVNVNGTINALSFAKKQKRLERFVFFSSCAVYGANPIMPLKESSMLLPVSFYGVTKEQAEVAVLYCKEVNWVIVRLFNVYGKGQSDAFFVPSITKKIENGEKVFVVKDSSRDFISVVDACEKIIMVAEKGCDEVYNVGSGKEVFIEDFVHVTGIILNKKPVVCLKKESNEIVRSYACIKKTNSLGDYL